MVFRMGVQPAAHRRTADPQAAQSFRGPAAIVLGSEAHGLSAEWSGPGVTAIRLPMRGAIGSLNASVAGSILLFEAVGQRDPGAPADA